MAGITKFCPYDCPDFNRFGSCEHEQKVKASKSSRIRSPSSTIKRRGSLPTIWSSLMPSSPPTTLLSQSSRTTTGSSSASGGSQTSKASASSQQTAPASTASTLGSHRGSGSVPADWYLARSNDELLNVHFEMMLRELAVPEKTQSELIRNQSVEQKKRLLRLHSMYQRPAESSSNDWVERFSGRRSATLTLADLDDALVGIRTANRTALEQFLATNGIEKLADAAHRVAIMQDHRAPHEAALLEGCIRCLDYLSRVQLGIQELVGNDDVPLTLCLCARLVPIENTSPDPKDVEVSVNIVVAALNLLTKLGFSGEAGADAVLRALKKSSLILRETGASYLYSLLRLMSRGVLKGEPFQLAQKCQREDSEVRLAIVRFFNAIVEMPFADKIQREQIIRALQDLEVEAEVKTVFNTSISKDFSKDFATQMELLAAFLARADQVMTVVNGKGGAALFADDQKDSLPVNHQLMDSHEGGVCVIPSAAVTLRGVIGSGSFGTVHLGQYRGAKVAVKCMHRRDSAATNVVLREAQMLGRSQNHPHIVRFFGICFEKNEIQLVFEYCELGSLEDVVVRSSERVQLHSVVNYGKQTAAGLAHLHAVGVIHRDVAARNVLVDSRGICKVSDFGMARIKYVAHQNGATPTSSAGKTSSSSNPLKWAAPESLRDRVFSKSSDSWMFGVFLWEIWFQSIPFPTLDHFAAGCKVAFEQLSPDVQNDRGREAPELMAICSDCWNADPEQRPLMEDLVERLEFIAKNTLRAVSGTFSVPKSRQQTTTSSQYVPVGVGQSLTKSVYSPWE